MNVVMIECPVEAKELAGYLIESSVSFSIKVHPSGDYDFTVDPSDTDILLEAYQTVLRTFA